jgi:hypothetical protein
MARFDDISDDDRKEVARQAAPLLLQLQGPRLGGPGAPVVLGDSLVEEMITPQWVASDADAPLKATGHTLSLVESPNVAGPATGANSGATTVVGYVRHAVAGAAKAVQITAVSASDIAAEIRSALTWIDANVSSDPKIRVLTAPAYQLTALGLYQSDNLASLVVVTPCSRDLPLVNQRLYAPGEFQKLLQQVAPIGGVRP